MPHPILLDLLLAAIPFALGMAATWRLIWPWWKIPGKTAAYFAGVALLSAWIGHWSLLLALAHQGLGLGFHIWFCRRHGLAWYAITDPEEYKRLSRAMLSPAPPPTPPRVLHGVPLPVGTTLQFEGEKPDIAWHMATDEEDADRLTPPPC